MKPTSKPAGTPAGAGESRPRRIMSGRMKSIIKRTVMWLHNHGVLNKSAASWMFSTFNLGSA